MLSYIIHISLLLSWPWFVPRPCTLWVLINEQQRRGYDISSLHS
jgi:hypothetical protein